jgi:hypothetical protein
MSKPCMQPGCAEEGVIPVEDGNWMCVSHAQERVNLPHNLALTEAGMEYDEFLEGGGKVS